jgi:predicted nucleic acid-binding protein
MITAVDTNVLIGIWNKDDALNALARSAIDAALSRGSLAISAPVFAELLASPSRTEAFLDYFFKETGIAVDWELNESDWRTAGRAFQIYAARRRRQRDPGPRRILTDFLIGAHALRRGYHLLTLDDRHYSAAFPRLSIIAI